MNVVDFNAKGISRQAARKAERASMEGVLAKARFGWPFQGARGPGAWSWSEGVALGYDGAAFQAGGCGIRDSLPRLLRGRKGARGFTLIELLVVLLIIGIVSAISIPALKGIGQSNTMASATRQLMDDLSFARHKAMTGRTTVHVVFVPPNLPSASVVPLTTEDGRLYQRLRESGPLTSYAIYAERTPGDQPGQPTRRYLTKWRSLPEGTFIVPWQFDVNNANNAPIPAHVFQPAKVLFPSVNARDTDELPQIAFDQYGRVVRWVAGSLVGHDEFIWVTKGSVMAVYDGAGNLTMDVRESPRDNWTNNMNRIRIDSVTGRARLERPEIDGGSF